MFKIVLSGKLLLLLVDGVRQDAVEPALLDLPRFWVGPSPLCIF